MNILFLNNYNYIRGGAENVFLSEAGLTKSAGHGVNLFCRSHPDNKPDINARFFPSAMVTDSLKPSLDSLRSLSQMVYSREAAARLDQMLGEVPIDVAHAHNIYGRLTTSVLDCLYRHKIPVVMTLHDYKLICPSYKLMFRNRVCEACKGRRYYHAVLKGCHKESRIASAIYAAETLFNDILDKYRRNVTTFIAPSRFLKNKLVEFGWPAQQISYVPNFIVSENFQPQFKKSGYFIYLGRLSQEKGIGTLIHAFQKIGSRNARLKIVGEGPLKSSLQALIAGDERIEFTGYLSGADLAEVIRGALAMVIPSEWYENAPMSVLEAFACGTPVIGARIGGIPEMIEDGVHGYLFDSGNATDLQEKLELMLDMAEERVRAMGRAVRLKVEAQYCSARHYDMLMDVYQHAIEQRG